MKLILNALAISAFIYSFGLTCWASDPDQTLILRKTGQKDITIFPRDLIVSQNTRTITVDQMTTESASLLHTTGILPKVIVIELRSAEYSTQTQQFVTRLISDFTLPGDIILLSGANAIQSSVIGHDKLALLDFFHGQLNKHAEQFSKLVFHKNQHLNTECNRIINAIKNSDATSIPLFTQTLSFLQTFPNQIEGFIQENAFFNTDGIKKTFSSLPLPPGERWWFRIVDMRSLSSLLHVPMVIRYIRGFMRALDLANTTMVNHVNTLMNSSEISHYLNRDDLVDTFLSYNCRPITLFVNSDGEQIRSEGSHGIFRSIFTLSNELSESCGAFSEMLNDTEKLCTRLHQHKDHYWKLYAKNQQLSTNSPIEINNKSLKCVLLQTNQSNSLSIIPVQIQQLNQSVFHIDGCQIDPDKKSGLLTVQLTMLNNQGEKVFHTRRTLQTADQSIRIAIPLPKSQDEANNLIIEGYDHLGVQYVQTLKGPLFHFNRAP